MWIISQTNNAITLKLVRTWWRQIRAILISLTSQPFILNFIKSKHFLLFADKASSDIFHYRAAEVKVTFAVASGEWTGHIEQRHCTCVILWELSFVSKEYKILSLKLPITLYFYHHNSWLFGDSVKIESLSRSGHKEFISVISGTSCIDYRCNRGNIPLCVWNASQEHWAPLKQSKIVVKP